MNSILLTLLVGFFHNTSKNCCVFEHPAFDVHCFCVNLFIVEDALAVSEDLEILVGILCLDDAQFGECLVSEGVGIACGFL